MAELTNCESSEVAQTVKHEMRNYTAETFLPYSGQVLVFQVTGTGASLGLRLTEVSRSKFRAAPAGFREPFSLLFTVVSGEASSGGLYRLMHDDFETCDWHLSRVVVPGRDASIPYYEAVFA